MNQEIEVKENSIAIIGWHDGGAGRIETWLEETHGYHIACFINPSDKHIDINPKEIQRDVSQFSYPTSDSFKGRPLINKYKWVEYLILNGITKALITTEDPKRRYNEIIYAKKHNIELINAIHPTAQIEKDVILKENIILHERAVISYRAELYDGTIIDGAMIGHHSVIRECCFVTYGAVLGGNVTLGKLSTVFIGAMIKNRTKIGENVVIGAGAVVLNDVNHNSLVIQKPGKVTVDDFYKQSN